MCLTKFRRLLVTSSPYRVSVIRCGSLVYVWSHASALYRSGNYYFFYVFFRHFSGYAIYFRVRYKGTIVGSGSLQVFYSDSNGKGPLLLSAKGVTSSLYSQDLVSLQLNISGLHDLYGLYYFFRYVFQGLYLSMASVKVGNS